MSYTTVSKPTGTTYSTLPIDIVNYPQYGVAIYGTSKYGKTDTYTSVAKPIFYDPTSLIDSYSETNKSSGASLLSSSRGQSFSVTDTCYLDSIKFYLEKLGSPTGNTNVVIYAHSGTYGVDGIPTGSILATSNNIDSSTIPASFGLVTFTFSGANRIILNAGIKYFAVIPIFGTIGNTFFMGLDTISPTASGNYAYAPSTTWTAQNTTDACFYIYGQKIYLVYTQVPKPI